MEAPYHFGTFDTPQGHGEHTLTNKSDRVSADAAPPLAGTRTRCYLETSAFFAHFSQVHEDEMLCWHKWRFATNHPV